MSTEGTVITAVETVARGQIIYSRRAKVGEEKHFIFIECQHKDQESFP